MFLNRLNTKVLHRTLCKLDIMRGSPDSNIKKVKARLTVAVKAHMGN